LWKGSEEEKGGHCEKPILRSLAPSDRSDHVSFSRKFPTHGSASISRRVSAPEPSRRRPHAAHARLTKVISVGKINFKISFLFPSLSFPVPLTRPHACSALSRDWGRFRRRFKSAASRRAGDLYGGPRSADGFFGEVPSIVHPCSLFFHLGGLRCDRG
jgi:hypothetical protein